MLIFDGGTLNLIICVNPFKECTKHDAGTSSTVHPLVYPPPYNLIPAQMASGSGTHTGLLELTQEIDLSHEVIISTPFTSNQLVVFQRSDDIASVSRAVTDRGLLERFVPVFILSQKKVMKMRKLEMLRSEGVTIHSCSECDYQSQYKGSLTVHLRTHSGVKTFECNQCDQKFSVKSSLTAHMRTHQGLKRLECEVCNYKCNTNRELNYHRLTHTGERPYKCDQCDFSCIRKADLVNHKRMHTGEKPFSWTICEFKGRTSALLLQLDNYALHCIMASNVKHCMFLKFLLLSNNWGGVQLY